MIRTTANRRVTMARMFNPPRPGKVLREYLGGLAETDAASRPRITRTALSRMLKCFLIWSSMEKWSYMEQVA